MICPYCQSNIKDNADKTTCSSCHTSHHSECWEENRGCTTYGCLNNPLTYKPIDIGNLTIADIQKELKQPIVYNIKYITCPGCNSNIPEKSVFCNFCGYNLIEVGSEKGKEEFEKEFKRRYIERINFSRKRLLLTTISSIIFFSMLLLTAYLGVKKIDSYFNSEQYKLKVFVNEWKDAWESKNIEKYKSMMDKDYMYFEKDGKGINFEERVKRIKFTFENYKNIKINISDLKIVPDSSAKNYSNITFKQNYVSDKREESGKKTLRLYKGEDTGNKWKIFREYFE